MPLERTEQQEPHKGTVLLIALEQSVSDRFQERPIALARQTLQFIGIGFPAFADFFFENRAIQLRLRVEVPENDGFIDVCLSRKIASCGAPEAVLGKDLHGSFQNILPLTDRKSVV